jgi:hypothetical protein
MRRVNKLLFLVVAVLLCAVPAFAEGAPAAAAVDTNIGLKALAAGIGFAIAVFGGARSVRTVPLCGAARNPGASKLDHDDSWLALIESLVLFALHCLYQTGSDNRAHRCERSRNWRSHFVTQLPLRTTLCLPET